MTIEESNKLIADFMGLETELIDGYAVYKVGALHTNVKYDSSWDWLMPVYQRIINEELYGKDAVGIKRVNKIYERLSCGVNIEVIWKAIVEFIKWYNLQNA
jgi:hypothetical protein